MKKELALHAVYRTSKESYPSWQALYGQDFAASNMPHIQKSSCNAVLFRVYSLCLHKMPDKTDHAIFNIPHFPRFHDMALLPAVLMQCHTLQGNGFLWRMTPQVSNIPQFRLHLLACTCSRVVRRKSNPSKRRTWNCACRHVACPIVTRKRCEEVTPHCRWKEKSNDSITYAWLQQDCVLETAIPAEIKQETSQRHLYTCRVSPSTRPSIQWSFSPSQTLHLYTRRLHQNTITSQETFNSEKWRFLPFSVHFLWLP